MATKAAKSLTINATKFELANKLNIENGKLQLIAKDVVLDEVELPTGASDIQADMWGSTERASDTQLHLLDENGNQIGSGAWVQGRYQPVYILIDKTIDFSNYFTDFDYFGTNGIIGALEAYRTLVSGNSSGYEIPYTVMMKDGTIVNSLIFDYYEISQFYLCFWHSGYSRYICYPLGDTIDPMLVRDTGAVSHMSLINFFKKFYPLTDVHGVKDPPVKLKLLGFDTVNSKVRLAWDSIMYDCTSVAANNPVTVMDYTFNKADKSYLVIGSLPYLKKFAKCVDDCSDGSNANIHGAIYSDMSTGIYLAKFDNTQIISQTTLA